MSADAQRPGWRKQGVRNCRWGTWPPLDKG